MVLIIGGLAAPVLAQNNTITVGDLQFTIDQNAQTAKLSGKVACPNGELVIPDHVEDDEGQQYPVTSIGNNVFQNCQQLTSITFPSSLTSIGEKAFNGCTRLTSVIIPSSLTNLGPLAFNGCTSITSVQYNALDATYSHGDYGPFNGCDGIETFTIGNDVRSIPGKLLAGTPITSIDIPTSVTSIGGSAFKNCSQLRTVYYNSRNIAQIGGAGNYVFHGCNSLETIVVGPEVERIPKYAFFDVGRLFKCRFTYRNRRFCIPRYEPC